jgi:Zn-dependent protease with chaperone function
MTDFRMDSTGASPEPPVPPTAPPRMPPPAAYAPIAIQPWASEQPLFLLMLLTALALWGLLLISIIGIFYALLFGLFFFGAHLALVAHVRGSAVRLGPQQFPDIFRRVQELSRQVGLPETPDVYIMQEGGALNAFASKLFSRSFIVLYSDLLDACGDNTDARDFVIAHELGHLAAKHLQWQAVLAPAMLVPFLWNAYSRAREYTCDRYGMTAARDRQAALRGLAILAAGGRLGPSVHLDRFVEQRADLNSPLLKLGSWLSTHPPLCDRLAALEPALTLGVTLNPTTARLGALAIVGSLLVLPMLSIVAIIAFAALAPRLATRAVAPAALSAGDDSPAPSAEALAEEAEATRQQQEKARTDISRLVEAIEHYNATHGRLPFDGELPAAWTAKHADAPLPEDADWESPYQYFTDGQRYLLVGACHDCSYLSGDGGRWGDWSSLSDVTPSSTPEDAKKAR